MTGERKATNSSARGRATPRHWIDLVDQLLRDDEPKVNHIAIALMQMIAAMHRQFEEEEDLGRYEEAIYAVPSLTALAEHLRHEHADLIRNAEQLRARFLADDKNPRQLRGFRGRFDEFCQQYLEHEAGEQSLTQDSLSGSDWGFREEE